MLKHSEKNMDIRDIEVDAEIIDLNKERAVNFMDHREPILPPTFNREIPPDGSSTRIVDRCIQEYFKNGVTYVYRGRGKKYMALHEKVFEIFNTRMGAEHTEECYEVSFKEVDAIWCFVIKKVSA